MRMEDAVRALIACVGEENFLRELAKVEDRYDVSIRGTIEAVLTEMGVPRHLKGWRTAVAAVELALEQEDALLTKDIYPGVGKAVGCTAAAAERRLRDAVEWMWDHAPASMASAYFPGWAADLNGRRPTVGAFVAVAADRVRERMKNAAVG